MKTAAIYARVSTERQKEKHTIASQLSILPEIVKQKGYIQIQEPYVDDGISGETIEDRPAMTRLLEDAERGLFDAVFVIDIDRLTRARKSIDWEIIKDTFRKNKVYVITPGQEYNFEDEDQEFISDIFSRISSYEKKKILRRMLRGKMEKAKQGKFFGGKPPLGYKLNEVTRRYEIVAKEADIIKEIFNLCLLGLSTEKIQEHLNELGYATPVDLKGYNHHRKSKKWAKSTITKILTNSMYAGEYTRWKNKRFEKNVFSIRPKDEWVVTQIPEIVSKDVFELAQEALKSRRSLSTRNTKREYLLSGLIYCESCGCKMTGECYKIERRYYVCANARRKHLKTQCPLGSIKADDMEHSVWEEIKSLLKSPMLLKQAILKSETINQNGEKQKELTRLLEEKEKEEARLLDLYQLGKFDIEVLNSRIEKLREEKQAINEKIEDLNESHKLDTRLKTINELRIELEADIDSFDFEKKRKVLRILLWGKPGVGVYLKPDYSVEIRGTVDFSKLNNISEIEKEDVIENTSYS